MGKGSKIAWCDHTFNPVRGCTRYSDGCALCYAETMSRRNPSSLGEWGPFGTRSIAAESYWRQLPKWNAEAQEAGRVATVFCASLADLFEGSAGVDRADWGVRVAEMSAMEEPAERAAAQADIDAWVAEHERQDGPRADYLPMLERLASVTATLPWLRVLALSKRPHNQLAWAKARGGWPSTWAAGCTIEDQKNVKRLDHFLQVPADIHFLSVEPMLSMVDIRRYLLPAPCRDCGGSGTISDPQHPLHPSNTGDGLGEDWCPTCTDTGEALPEPAIPSWVICGIESRRAGIHKLPGRHCETDWIRSLRDQCVGADLPFFYKQGLVGSEVVELPELDGVVWAQEPEALRATP